MFDIFISNGDFLSVRNNKSWTQIFFSCLGCLSGVWEISFTSFISLFLADSRFLPSTWISSGDGGFFMICISSLSAFLSFSLVMFKYFNLVCKDLSKLLSHLGLIGFFDLCAYVIEESFPINQTPNFNVNLPRFQFDLKFMGMFFFLRGDTFICGSLCVPSEFWELLIFKLVECISSFWSFSFLIFIILFSNLVSFFILGITSILMADVSWTVCWLA